MFLDAFVCWFEKFVCWFEKFVCWFEKKPTQQLEIVD